MRQFQPKVMPATHRLFKAHSSRFGKYFAPTPQCCPSRAALLTGQYGHNNGVTSNPVGYPGLEQKRSTLPVWLSRAGYKTIHVGKFLNGYERVTSPGEVAPGWDSWHTPLGGSRYYRYEMSNNGKVREYGDRPRDHATTVFNRKAAGAVKASVGSRRPFFLELDHRTPHSGRGPGGGRCNGNSIPAPRDENLFRRAELPEVPSFNERNVRDKPRFLRQKRLDRGEVKDLTLKWQCTLASLAAVDRGIARLRELIGRAGELRHTVFVFLSDNGYYFGEHRVQTGKVIPYEEASRIPLRVRVPSAYLGGATPPRNVDEVTGNIDIAPTLLELAEAEPCVRPGDCRILDGRSLVPLLARADLGFPAERSLLYEFSSPRAERGVCAYQGVRRSSDVFIDFLSVATEEGGECKPTNAAMRYDLESDPFELRNVCDPACPDDPAQQELSASVDRLVDCAGIAGRDPLPPSGHYCD